MEVAVPARWRHRKRLRGGLEGWVGLRGEGNELEMCVFMRGLACLALAASLEYLLGASRAVNLGINSEAGMRLWVPRLSALHPAAVLPQHRDLLGQVAHAVCWQTVCVLVTLDQKPSPAVQWTAGGPDPWASGLHPPLILKPLPACGSPHAHDLALVYDSHAFATAPVQLPAIAQALIDHGSMLHKVYVIGDQVSLRSGESAYSNPCFPIRELSVLRKVSAMQHQGECIRCHDHLALQAAHPCR